MNYNIALAFDYLEDVNYALVQSKMNICNWCIIENNSEVDMENMQLEISGEFVETYLSMPFRLDASQRIRIQDIKLQVKTSKLLSLTERVKSCLILKLKNGEEVVYRISCDVALVSVECPPDCPGGHFVRIGQSKTERKFQKWANCTG